MRLAGDESHETCMRLSEKMGDLLASSKLYKAALERYHKMVSVINDVITYLVLYTVNTTTDISRMTQRHTSTVAKHRINDITHV